MEDTLEDTLWIDDMGDKLEAEGVDPGHIFEWHGYALPKTLPEGIVVLKDQATPGHFPKPGDYHLVKEIIVQETSPTGNQIHRLSPNTPVCVMHWLRIYPHVPHV